MVTTPIQSARLDYQVIHHSRSFPVKAGATPCGAIGPAALEWRFATCIRCLDAAAPAVPAARARREALAAERAENA